MSQFNSARDRELLNEIAKLLKYKKYYNLALQELEIFFQKNIETNSKEYLYARVLLLDAYLYNGYSDKAIGLCQELSRSKHQTTQILAQYYLTEIFLETKTIEQKSSLNISKSLLIPAQAAELLNTGYEAMTKKRYQEAIRAFKIFFQAASPATKQYLQAQKWLIKAYQENEEINQAIALCQKLLIHEHEATRKWARQLLFTDLFIDDLNLNVSATSLNPNESEIKPQSPSKILPGEPEPAIVKFTPKTLKEFKVFCQTNLLSELKVFESLRKQVLISIFTTHLLFLYLVIALLKLFPVVSYFLKNPTYFQIGSSIISIPFLFIFFLFYYLLVFLLLFGVWIFFMPQHLKHFLQVLNIKFLNKY
ncbi:MAG: hypothetical protein V7K47_13425 [Nostoc sp.]